MDLTVVRRGALIAVLTCLAASGALAATAAAPARANSVSATCTAGGAPADDCNAWYRTSVTLQWQWSPTQGVVSTLGCDVQTLSNDTSSSGTPKTCEVDWMNGDKLTAEKRIHVDTTPPAVTDGTPGRGPDQNGWYNHPVEFAFHGSDATSGLQGCSSVTYGGPDSASATVTGICRDVAGNVASRDVSLRYDATPPTVDDITLSRPPDHDGWYTAPVDFGFRGSDSTSGVDGCSAGSYRGPDGANMSVTGTCTDRAGNAASRSFGINYDATPPTLDAVAATAGNHSAALSWLSSLDTTSLVIVRSPVGARGVTQSLSPGLETGFRDTGLRNGVEYRYDLTATDAAGNAAHASVTVVPSAHPRLRPRAGASVSSPPLLRWTGVTKATYYNVQLYRDDTGAPVDAAQPPPGSEKILSRWPRKPQFRLRRSWNFGGHRRRLSPGRYRWYVWAGYGARSKQLYGGQIVNSTFTVAR
jgi:hypothetical protein